LMHTLATAYRKFDLLFFFQAEDGIRDATVTGVQTCALPIYPDPRVGLRAGSTPPRQRSSVPPGARPLDPGSGPWWTCRWPESECRKALGGTRTPPASTP